MINLIDYIKAMSKDEDKIEKLLYMLNGFLKGKRNLIFAELEKYWKPNRDNSKLILNLLSQSGLLEDFGAFVTLVDVCQCDDCEARRESIKKASENNKNSDEDSETVKVIVVGEEWVTKMFQELFETEEMPKQEGLNAKKNQEPKPQSEPKVRHLRRLEKEKMFREVQNVLAIIIKDKSKNKIDYEKLDLFFREHKMYDFFLKAIDMHYKMKYDVLLKTLSKHDLIEAFYNEFVVSTKETVVEVPTNKSKSDTLEEAKSGEKDLNTLVEEIKGFVAEMSNLQQMLETDPVLKPFWNKVKDFLYKIDNKQTSDLSVFNDILKQQKKQNKNIKKILELLISQKDWDNDE